MMKEKLTADRQTKRDMRLCESLLREATIDRGRWESIVEMTFPELLNAADLKENEAVRNRPPICPRARQGILKLASAHMTFITPMGDRWFQFESWENQSEADEGWMDQFDWFMQTTEIAQKELERSNFYTELIGTYIDRSVTGTGLLLIESMEEKGFNFTHIPAGTYGLAENNLHEVDTVVRKFMLTPAQIIEDFGEEACSEQILADYKDTEKRYSTRRLIYHLVEPVIGRESDDEMPYRSVYIDVDSGHLLLQSGYWEFPFIATRFIRYGSKVYGDSALAGLEKVMLDLSKIQEALKITAERKALPSVLISAELAEEVDFSAGGKTIISQSDAAMGVPREWASAGDQREMIEYAGTLMEQIDDATFVSILQTISSVDRQMTAREVSARESEKVMTFTQSFTQFGADFKPAMNRIFAMLYRMGKLNMDTMPNSLKEVFVDIETGNTELLRVLPPKVSYIGRMAQSLQYAQHAGLSNTLMELVELYQMTENNEFLMPLDPSRVARYKLNAAGVPHMCMVSPARVRKMKREMQEAAAQQQQAALAEQQSAAQRNMAQAEANMRR